MTRAELRARLLRLLFDDPVTPVFWSAAELDTLLDEAQDVLAEDLEAFTRTFVIPRRPGAMLHNLRGLSPQVMRPWRLWSPERQHRLTQISMRELDARLPRTWMTTHGQPEYWFTVSWETFGVWPIPSEGGGVHRIECLIWPDPIPSDDTELAWSAPTQDALLPYVQCEAALKEHDVARAQEYEAQYLAYARARKGKEGVNRLQTGPWGRVP